MLGRVSLLGLASAALFACSAKPPTEESANLNPSERSEKTPAHEDAAAVDRSGALAFPGAIGHGARAIGGRGGKVIHVTTLADRVPGSLRECLDAEGARVCVFDVAGTIRFEGSPPIIRNPFLTIAGESAPGEGITLAHSGGAEARSPLLIKKTHDVIVRHIRVRNDRMGDNRESEDAITIESSEYVILDHVSGSWALDEVVNGYGDNDFITISNSIFAFGLPKHDKCALLASDPFDAQHFTFARNICAHNGDRNPDINFPPGSCVEVVNNVFFNAQSEFAEVWETYGGTPVSLVGNWFIGGPDTTGRALGIVRQQLGSKGPAQLYEADNRFEGNFRERSDGLAEIAVDVPPCALTVTPEPAAQLVADLLGNSGAWPHDAVDRQVVADIRARKGRIVKRPGQIPDPSSSNARSPRDSDGDGLPDDWEAARGSLPNTADSWDHPDDSGWSYLELYLDERATQRKRG